MNIAAGGSGAAIEARGLTKRYGAKLAVDDLSFTVMPGRVTGFLGPNGAGKSSTMRLLLGLDRPDSGVATIGGKRYRDLRDPLRQVGALLDAGAAHKSRSVRDHLTCLAQTQGLPRRRVAEVIAMTGLDAVAAKRARGLSLGMAQRLGIAAALLGDPGVLMLDEPVNGLDPEGVAWIRNLVRQLAAEGRTVLVSSHLMNEMAVTADHLIVIGRGRLLADRPAAEFIERHSELQILVKVRGAARLAGLVAAEGGQVRPHGDEALVVTGLPARRVAELAAEARFVVYELTPQRASLEQAFLELTAASQEFAGRIPVTAAGRDAHRAERNSS